MRGEKKMEHFHVDHDENTVLDQMDQMHEIDDLRDSMYNIAKNPIYRGNGKVIDLTPYAGLIIVFMIALFAGFAIWAMNNMNPTPELLRNLPHPQ